ncbi:MAG: hypothetical protein WCL32_26115, partial [Planctomycetota bacterium]
MIKQTFVLADASRVRQFARLGRRQGLFRSFELFQADDGIYWGRCIAKEDVFAVSTLGPGWCFCPVVQQLRADDLAVRRTAMSSATATDQREKLEAIVRDLNRGVVAERLLWFIHCQILLRRTSLLRLTDRCLR